MPVTHITAELPRGNIWNTHHGWPGAFRIRLQAKERNHERNGQIHAHYRRCQHRRAETSRHFQDAADASMNVAQEALEVTKRLDRPKRRDFCRCALATTTTQFQMMQ